MFRTLALFPKTAASHFDIDYFLNKHVPMVEELLEDHGLVRIEVEEGVSVAPPGPTVSYAVLASLNFSTLKAWEGAMAAHALSSERTLPFSPMFSHSYRSTR